MSVISEVTTAYRANPAVAEQATKDVHAMLVRSSTDRQFRNRLITEPRAAFAEFSGRPIEAIPPVNIVFVENKADATIVLPDFVEAGGELSADELEAVAGGTIATTLEVIASAALVGATLAVGSVIIGEVAGIMER